MIDTNAIGAHKDARLLIVDDDHELCRALQETVTGWGIKVKTMSEPGRVADHLKNTSYNVVLLDVVMPEKSGFDLIPEIEKVCPDAKVVLMTRYADKEKAIKALRTGAFDFLEKPIQMTVLSHTVKRALDSQKVERELKKTLKELERSQGECLVYGRRLEEINEQLLETNKALSVLAENLERTREESEKRIVRKIRLLIVPIVEKLQRDRKLKGYRTELRMLMDHIEELTLSLANDSRISSRLTPTEVRIASMIMNDLTSQEIANQLNISPDTVKTHRRNIRKKLNIKHSDVNLRAYLLSRMRKRHKAS
ncbi:MAG: response regulator [Desulfobacterales bacterium]|nr:MAG: response regulator [Desulfobacterales bacterium]